MSAVCYCGREECGAVEFRQSACFSDLRARLAAVEKERDDILKRAATHTSECVGAVKEAEKERDEARAEAKRRGVELQDNLREGIANALEWRREKDAREKAEAACVALLAARDEMLAVIVAARATHGINCACPLCHYPAARGWLSPEAAKEMALRVAERVREACATECSRAATLYPSRSQTRLGLFSVADRARTLDLSALVEEVLP